VLSVNPDTDKSSSRNKRHFLSPVLPSYQSALQCRCYLNGSTRSGTRCPHATAFCVRDVRICIHTAGHCFLSYHFTAHLSVSIAIRLWAGRSTNPCSILSKVHTIQTGCSVHPFYYTTSTAGTSLGVNQAKRESDHSALSIVEVKNKWAHTPAYVFKA
jgi:hypothetical protein